MSGYNDPEMLRAAIELAQSFSKTKAPPKRKVGGGGLAPRQAPRQEHREPYQAGQQSRYSQVTAPPRQIPLSSGSLAPPPSRRRYGTAVNFSTGRADRSPVIGSLGLDFIRPPNSKVEPPNNEKAEASPVSATKQESQIDPPTEKDRNNGATKPDPIYTPPRSSGNGQAENILDAFYSILAKKPSIGQEIETLADILPKAMDLNAPGTATMDTPPIKEKAKLNNRQCTCLELDGKGKHEKACFRYLVQEKNIKKAQEVHSNGEAKAGDVNCASKNPGVERKPNNEFSHSHSRKLSPDAPVFVPKVNEAREQTVGTNGEHQISNEKPTKGLSASMWA